MQLYREDKHPGGRPPKFTESRRPITITLPERTLKLLETIDKDRAKAIVKSVDAISFTGENHPLVEVLEVAPGLGMIFIAPCPSLCSVNFLKLIEITPARYLISITTGTPTDSLELGIQDLLDELPQNADKEREREILSQLLKIVKSIRKNHKITKSEILFVNLKD